VHVFASGSGIANSNIRMCAERFLIFQPQWCALLRANFNFAPCWLRGAAATPALPHAQHSMFRRTSSFDLYLNFRAMISRITDAHETAMSREVQMSKEETRENLDIIGDAAVFVKGDASTCHCAGRMP
jgi:hypothetical protein